MIQNQVGFFCLFVYLGVLLLLFCFGGRWRQGEVLVISSLGGEEQKLSWRRTLTVQLDYKPAWGRGWGCWCGGHSLPLN